MAIEGLANLVSLAQMGALEIHVWGSKFPQIDLADQMVFDLDPDTDLPWQKVVVAAQKIYARLKILGLKSFLKTTGGKGLHIVVPLLPEYKSDVVKDISKLISEDISAQYPGLFTTSPLKEKRAGKVFIDYLRNGYAATTVASFSPRARPGAYLAWPIAWEDIKNSLQPGTFSLVSYETHFRKFLSRDPWKEFESSRQSLAAFADVAKQVSPRKKRQA